MKRRIEPEQLRELTDEQLQKLQSLWVTELGDYMTDFSTEEDGRYFVGICKYIKSNSDNKAIGFPLLDIGQMIEFLSGMSSIFTFHRYDDCNGESWNVRGTLYRQHDRYYETLEPELCDALWQAVKAVL